MPATIVCIYGARLKSEYIPPPQFLFSVIWKLLARTLHSVRFGKLNASGVYYSYYMISGPNFEFRRPYTNFGTKIPVFRDNSGCLMDTK